MSAQNVSGITCIGIFEVKKTRVAKKVKLMKLDLHTLLIWGLSAPKMNF